MDEFSGIRATKRRILDHRLRRRALALLLAAASLAPLAPAEASSGHGEEKPAPAAAPPPPPPPPPRPRPPPPPPPVLKGPIAAPQPRAKVIWVADPTTGLALGGFDPVAYFLVDRPTLGRPEFEWDWGGTTWRFADEGARAAFRDAPEAYAPLYGGRCAFSVADGRPAEGSPQFFLIHRGRLLLFADAESRAAFLLAPDRLRAEGERRWPAMLADLP